MHLESICYSFLRDALYWMDCVKYYHWCNFFLWYYRKLSFGILW